MEHYVIVKRDNIQKVDIQNLSVEYLQKIRNKFNSILYVTSQESYIGCIGQKEYCKCLEDGQIFINKGSIYLITGEFEVREAGRIFDQKPSIKKIPVLDSNGHLLYEYERNYEEFYKKLKIDSGINTEHDDRYKIIVSLTSYGKRLETVYLSIKSMMYQTMKPDKIILYLDKETGNRQIKNEEELIRAGLTIRRNVENLKPHTKYYYAMQEFDKEIIITVDDDIIYDDFLIEELYKKHLDYPNTVICRRGHRLKFQENHLDLYENWEFCVKSTLPSNDICATGVGGVLYPGGLYRNAFLDREAIIQNALNADDLWLKMVELVNGINIYATGDVPLRYIHDTQQEALKLSNLDQGENNIILEKLQNYFALNIADIVTH